MIADVVKIGKPKFPILVVETVGEKTNEIFVRENEDLDAKIAKESLLAEKVFVENDGKSKCKQFKKMHYLMSQNKIYEFESCLQYKFH